MKDCRIRSLSLSEVNSTGELWRRTRPYDHVDPESLRRFLDNSPLCWPKATWVAEANGSVIGLTIGLRDGNIPLFFVNPDWVDEPAADALLQRVLKALIIQSKTTSAKASTCWGTGLSDCGHDSRYTDILEVFVRNGFVSPWKYEELDVVMEKDLDGFQIPLPVRNTQLSLEQEGFSFHFCQPKLSDRYIQLLRQHFPGYQGWIKRAEQFAISGGDPRLRILVLHSEDAVGFTHFEEDNIHSTGVRLDLRGKGIGTVLYFLALEEMARRGTKLLKLGEAVYDFYQKAGCRVVRRYMVMQKTPATPSKPLVMTAESAP